MFGEIEYRQTRRNAFCSICGKGIPKDTEKVITFQSIKGHMDTNHICEDCMDKMIDIYYEGENKNEQ